MHCQKVRSYLSAYCNDELTGSALSGVSDHLSICVGCRTEEQHFRDLLKGGRELDTYRVSEGFNNRLLDRIAHERFAETRTKAYFPKAAPTLLIRRLVPILVVAGLAVAVVIANFSPNKNLQADVFAVSNVQLDDAYLTAQPVNNPNLSGMLHKGWTLGDQMARQDRINRISRQLTFDFPFNYYNQGNAVSVSARTLSPTPFVDGFYRIQPVIRVFESANPNTSKEQEETY
jgi:hypothetical protein